MVLLVSCIKSSLDCDPSVLSSFFLSFSHVSDHQTTKNIAVKKHGYFSGKLGILTAGILRKIPNIRKYDKNHES